MSNGLSWYTRLPRRSIRSYPKRLRAYICCCATKRAGSNPRSANDDCFDGYPELSIEDWHKKSINVDGHTLLWGITANNNPTVQDVWNTIPAWSFPYISSALAPMPTASTFIEQVYAQQVAGLSAYTFLDDMFYLEFGGYRPLSTNTQLALGVDTTGQSPISGVAPYWRVAFEPHFGDHWWEIGTFGLASKVVPMRMSAAGTNSFTDIGVDTQYQYLGDPHTVTVRAAWIHENHNTSASQTLGLADNSNNQLRSLNASASYIYDHTWSLTAGRVSVGGTADATLYGTFSGSPNSAGWIFELAYLPFSHGGPAFWPWLNFRIGLHTRTGPNSMGRPQISTVWEETPAATIRSLHTSGLCSDSPRLRRLSPAHAQSPGEQLRRPCRSRGQDVRLAVGTAEQSTRVAASSGRAAHWPCQGRQDKIGLQGENLINVGRREGAHARLLAVSLWRAHDIAGDRDARRGYMG